MDPQLGGSFIPKAPLVQQKRRSGIGLAMFVAILLFILSIVAAGAVLAYEGVLNAQISQDQSSLSAAESAFEPDDITSLARLDSRITNTENLLQKHLAPSGVFDFLAQNTKENVQFTSFSFDDTGSAATISLDGIADSFSTVALQSDQFGASPLLKDVVFSNVTVGATGQVTFSLSATLDPSLYLYVKQPTSSQAIPNPAPASTTASTTTQ